MLNKCFRRKRRIFVDRREPTEQLPRFIDSLQYIPLFPYFNCTLLFQLNAELGRLVNTHTTTHCACPDAFHSTGAFSWIID